MGTPKAYSRIKVPPETRSEKEPQARNRLARVVPVSIPEVVLGFRGLGFRGLGPRAESSQP